MQMSAVTFVGEAMETAVIRSKAQVVEENAEAGAGDGALPGVVDPRSVAPRDARQLSRQFFQRLTELEEGTHEYQYARNTLIEMNMSLVRFAAGRFRGRSEIPLPSIQFEWHCILLVLPVTRKTHAQGRACCLRRRFAARSGSGASASVTFCLIQLAVSKFG